MQLSLPKVLAFVSLFVLGSPSRADLVTVGSLVFGNPLSTLQGFEVINETGPVNGCDAVDNIPVCTVLAFQNTSLTVTLADHSTISSTPSGGFSFGPGAYIYGSNAGDDPNQSFLFDPSLDIVSATFSGTVSPASFQVTDGTNQSTFVSTGVFSETLDLSDAPPLAAVDITVETANPLPEPAAMPVLVAAVSIALVSLRLFRRAVIVSTSEWGSARDGLANAPGRGTLPDSTCRPSSGPKSGAPFCSEGADVN